MKKILASLALVLSFAGYSADRIGEYDVQTALQRGYDEGVIDKSIPIYFKGQANPKYSKVIGEFKTNKKTNAFGKSDEEAVQWVFLSAVKQLLERAESEGGTAVINVVSNYRNKEFSSPTQFQCGAGAVIAGSALIGTVVK